ncbi:HNH endonuclease [Zunongwangia sp. F260]|uniref:HNH endonuclease n=1 Tax=Autumnicola lenta TaxID=3075593 RepID=A0ABU3CP84_9FLAO|nr:HNH endonuclease [Zunongwangia sp. F260]MDT0648164.1 HNH endonuclease [Zunongwangia sp. F260]
MKKRTPIPKLAKVRSELQKEIESICPFCANEDVGHFQIHHIDEIPSNHEMQNLLLICPICHSKINKGDISQQDVLDKKINILNKSLKVKFISISVDKNRCSWRPIKNTENAFEAVKLQSLFPIFNFSIINNSLETILLTGIRITARRLPIGLAGPNIPLPNILRPSITYKIKMPEDGETIETNLIDELEVPSKRAFKFQVELYDDSMERFKPPFNKYVLHIELRFNNDFYIKIPKVLLNTKEDYDHLSHSFLN